MLGLQMNWLDLVGKSIYRIENTGAANLLHVFFADGTEELWLADTILASRIKVVEAGKAVNLTVTDVAGCPNWIVEQQRARDAERQRAHDAVLAQDAAWYARRMANDEVTPAPKPLTRKD